MAKRNIEGSNSKKKRRSSYTQKEFQRLFKEQQEREANLIDQNNDKYEQNNQVEFRIIK